MFLYSTVSTLKPVGRKHLVSVSFLPLCKRRLDTNEAASDHRLADVEGVGRRLTNCGDSGDDFTELQLIQNGGLSGSVETDHENSHLLLST